MNTVVFLGNNKKRVLHCPRCENYYDFLPLSTSDYVTDRPKVKCSNCGLIFKSTEPKFKIPKEGEFTSFVGSESYFRR